MNFMPKQRAARCGRRRTSFHQSVSRASVDIITGTLVASS
jgi:hypothetical protein